MKKGFTLGEIIITLGIVGIVASLTIPSSVVKYQKKLYATGLQKEYSKLSEAVMRESYDEKVSNFTETKAGETQDDNCKTSAVACKSGIGYFLQNYIDNDKRYTCRSGSCFANNYKSLFEENLAAVASTADYCIRTIRGSSICGVNVKVNSVPTIRFYVDVNGVSGPNVGGRDLFVLEVRPNGSIENNCAASTCSDKSQSGIYNQVCGCLTNLVDNNWKMEY